MMSKVWMNPARAVRAAAALVLVLLGACGGGTQVEKFVPTRIVAFGDENSVIEADGRKYTVNGYDAATPPVLDCSVNPIWIQIVALQYGLRFPQCPGTAVSTPSRIRAFNGAKVADLAGQIAAAGPLGESDLASVFVGANDIFGIYAGCIGCNEATLTAQAQAAGTALAAQIFAITKTGAKVVFLTVPELGSTPYALAQNVLNPGAADLLRRLTVEFNKKLRTGVSNIDGRQGVQVLADDLFRPIVAAGSTTTGYFNVVDAICDPAVLNVIDCNTNTLRTAASNPVLTPGGTPANYLWAFDKYLSPGGHNTLGATAASRVAANPL